MNRTVNLVLRVDSDGYAVARQRMRELAAEAPTAERAFNRGAEAAERAAARQVAAEEKKAARAAAAAERQIQAAERAAARENEAWNNALQKAIAREEKRAAAAERTYQRQVQAAERAARREDEIWNNAIQKAKAREERFALGRDGVLPVRPSLQRIEARINQPAAGVGMLSGLGGTELASVAAGFVGVASAAAAAHKVIEETTAYDSLIARLTGVTGGLDEAKEKFNELEELSDGTVYTENQVTEAFLRMQQMGLEPTQRTLKAFSNIASATGSSLEDLAEVSLQASLGTFRGLRQFGIKAVQEGDNLKLTFKGVTTTITNSAEAITAYLVKIGETNFAGAAARQLDTMGGSVKQLEDAWGDLFREIGRNAIGEFISTGMREAAKAINGVTEAVEALFFTMSKRPKFTGMSASLADWVKGAERYDNSRATDEETARIDKVQAIIEGIQKGSLSQADKDLAEYASKRAELLSAMADGLYGDYGAAIAELDRQYAAKANGDKGKPEKKEKEYVLRSAEEDAQSKYEEMIRQQSQKEYETVVASLGKQEDAERKSYEDRKKFLSDYTGTDRVELWQRNEDLWGKHLDELAKKDAEAKEHQQQRRDDAFARFMSEEEKIRLEQRQTMEEYKKLLDEGIVNDEEYTQLKVKLYQEADRKIAESSMAQVAQMAQLTGAMFGNLASAAKNWGGETSTVYRTMFALQKASAIASTTVSMLQAIAKANAEGGPYAGPIIALTVGSTFASILSQLSSTNYAGAYDAGGYIPSGKVGLVGERGPEFVRGPAMVTGRAETARSMSAPQSSQPPITVSIMNIPEGQESAYRRSSRATKVVYNTVRRDPSLIRGIRL